MNMNINRRVFTYLCQSSQINPLKRRTVMNTLPLQRLQWNSERNHTDTPNNLTERELRSISVTSYYNQIAIDIAADELSVRLSPSSLLYSGCRDQTDLMRSAQYLHRELPIRLAHRIDGFRHLPFIIGCNPTILNVHELYIRTFRLLKEFPPITNSTDEEKFTELLKTLLLINKDVVRLLAEGFKECQKHIKNPTLVRNFLDSMLTSRLGIRMLTEHHIALHEDRPQYIGIIKKNFSPAKCIEKLSENIYEQCAMQYGNAPSVKVIGHVTAEFPYIPQPLEYIIVELIKNAFRATVEYHRDNRAGLPDVTASITCNSNDFYVRISDQGGGIAPDLIDRVWEYNFTTIGSSLDKQQQEQRDGQWGDFFGEVTRERNSPLAGYGFGLPTSRAFSSYLGGELSMQTMQGLGTDLFLRLRHINSHNDSFRI